MAAMKRRQRGMSLVAAIFLIVVVASLAAFAVTAGSSKVGATNQALMADRAAAAAHAGAEWGAYRARVANSCVGPPLSPAGVTFNVAQTGLRGFRVTVICTSTLHEAPLNWYVRDITAFAQYGNFGAADYAAHTAQARVSNAP
jgi:MSHA biogenesis protein MshP